MNAAEITLEGLNIVDGFNPAFASIVVDVEINTGDCILYTDDDGKIQMGEYITLWMYSHAGETSPFVGDSRMMAYVLKADGGSDYADVTSIVKLVGNTPTMII